MAAGRKFWVYVILINNAKFNPWLILNIQKSKMLDHNTLNITIPKNNFMPDTRFTQQSIPLFILFLFLSF